MTRWQELRPVTFTASLLAALTTWVTLLSWSPFAERPAGYLVPLLAGCGLVAVLGMLCRAGRLSAVLVLLVQLAVVLLWLHHRTVGEVALGGWVPTPASLQTFGQALGDASGAAQAYAAPVPRSAPEFDLLPLVGGLATAVVVDFLAVGLRRPPLAGLPLLAVYTAPVSILEGGVPWLKFAAAALCFLALLAADESRRLAHWGHQLGAGRVYDSQSTAVSSTAVWSSARRIGLTATGLAVVVPLFVPTLSASLFDGRGGSGNGSGDAVDIANPMLDLKRDLSRGADVELLRMTTPDPDPSYLRISVLNQFDGQTWRPSGRSIPLSQRADGPVARPPGLSGTVPSRKVTSTVVVGQDFRSRWLPTPYPVAAVRAPGDWRYDRTTLDFVSAADNQTTAGLTYSFTALKLDPTAQDLADATPAPPSVYTPYTALPGDFPASVRRLAAQVVDTNQSKFEQAVALQQWFRVDGGFRYSLARAPGNGTDDLVAFLRRGPQGRVGYCEQFAAAMAVMGRSLGIPSRVAVGFLQPDKVGNDTWAYSSHDLHAWPEMYFGGVGWVRFEPTPQTRTGGVPSYTTQQVPQAAPSRSSSAPAAAPSQNRADRRPDVVDPSTAPRHRSFVGSRGFVLTLVGTLLAGLLLLGPRTARSVVRRRRWSRPTDAAGRVEAAWRELRDSAVDLGLGWDDRASLRATAHDLAPEGDPAAAAALQRLMLLVERARYSRALDDDAVSPTALRADVDTCVRALRAGVDTRRRVRATWWPASLRAGSVVGGRGSRHRGRTSGPVTELAGVDRAR